MPFGHGIKKCRHHIIVIRWGFAIETQITLAESTKVPLVQWAMVGLAARADPTRFVRTLSEV